MESARVELVQELSGMLHDLCQPLTALQCRLELAELGEDETGLRRAISEGLVECERLNSIAARMREHLRGAMQCAPRG
ncbi:hypothetical protein [Terriglobus tenax]|uniref:hypothetical protein n=1 Tax=Terriglobus tenax TaxID=1111115 RepID=UPI0021E047F2|nr:hypothetical protein [Terriglobus tenax]